jgi:hypothetical protein
MFLEVKIEWYWDLHTAHTVNLPLLQLKDIEYEILKFVF